AQPGKALSKRSAPSDSGGPRTWVARIVFSVGPKPSYNAHELRMMYPKLLSRRSFIRGTTAAGAAIRVGLPALEAMFNPSGTAYGAARRAEEKPVDSRLVFWFNGNGIPEKYWKPQQVGTDFRITPCLQP